jgi:hypothetical protein
LVEIVSVLRALTLAITAAVASVMPSAAPPARAPSPIYGINLSMYGPAGADQFVDDPGTHALFARLGVPFVRVPFREGTSDQRLLTAMSAVKAAGATPVLNIHGPVVRNPLQVDLHLLRLAKSVFGSRTVYLEIGNEEDQRGITARAYTAAWRTIIPRLRAQSPPSYRYGGPVTAAADADYIAYFARHAVPRPDFLSWHEYVCNPQNSNQYCDAHIARWATHFATINAMVRAAIGTTLPIMITEWNLDPSDDPRYGDPPFIRPWVTAALAQLERLRSQGLIGAMYYTATSNSDDLVNPDRSLTPAGAAWRAALCQAVGSRRRSNCLARPSNSPN